MKLRYETVFREVWRTYQECQSGLVGASSVAGSYGDPGAGSGPQGRAPVVGDGVLFVAQFVTTGVEALTAEGLKPRRVPMVWQRRKDLFVLFHCGAGGLGEMKPRDARQVLHLKERAFWNHVEDVERVVGKAFRGKLWPVGRFFK